jgi:hypothetical protein
LAFGAAFLDELVAGSTALAAATAAAFNARRSALSVLISTARALFLALSLVILSLSLAIAFSALDTLAGFTAALATFLAGTAALEGFPFLAGLGLADFFEVAIFIDLL